MLCADNYPIALGLVVSCYVVALIRRKFSALDKIPTVGPSGILTSWIWAHQTMQHGHRLIQEGYEEHPIFKIPTRFSWLVVVAAPELLEDMRKANDDQISFLAALNQAVQFDYTLSPRINVDDCHIKVVRGVMTKNIGARYADVLDEINRTLGVLLAGADKDWVHIPTYLSVAQIVSRFSARFFAGPELSSNARYTEIMEQYAAHVVKHGAVLNMLPKWLRPFVSRLQFDTEGKAREIEAFLRPIIEKRLEKGMENPDADSNDMITWLWNGASEAHRTPYDVAIRMVWLNIAAIRTTSAVLTHALYDLATYNSYIEPLREEISTIIEAEGWNKISIEKMRKLDSFVKESQRVHGSSAAMSRRLTVNDFTFSDGTFIPKGTLFAVAGRAINSDGRIYANPHEFQGFRFVEKDSLKSQMTSLSLDFMVFGIGKRACPGRFFAVAELKTVLARILLDYDIKLTDEKDGRPADKWFAGLAVEPNSTAKISLRKRVSNK